MFHVILQPVDDKSVIPGAPNPNAFRIHWETEETISKVSHQMNAPLLKFMKLLCLKNEPNTLRD
jgi:hypothetical protein